MNYLGSTNSLAGYNSLPIYDTNIQGQIVSPATISPYSILTVPAYWRASTFKSGNLRSFPRSVRQAGIPLDKPHPLDGVLSRRANGYQSAGTFWETLFFHHSHYGNGFARITRQSAIGLGIASLHNLLPDDCVPFRIAPDDTAPYNWQQFYAVVSTGEVLVADEVIHLAGLSYDGMAGLSPTWMFRDTFQRALQQDRYITRFLMKGTIVRGSIEIPAGASEEQQQKIVDIIMKFHAGADAERDLLVLSGGATLQNKTLSNEQAQTIQLTGYTTKQISQITGVPAHFLQDDSEGKYNANIQTAGEEVVRYCFRPIIETVEDELTLKLLTPAEQQQGLHVHIDPNALLRGDIQTQTTVVAAQKAAGIISGNEARVALGYPKTDNPADDVLKTSGDTTPLAPDTSKTTNF